MADKPMPAKKDVAAKGHRLPENAKATHLFKGPNTATALWRRADLESRANRSQWAASLTFSVADSAQALTHSWGFALEIHMVTGPHLTTAKDFGFPHKEEFPFSSKSFMIKIFKNQLGTIQAMKIFEALKNWDRLQRELLILGFESCRGEMVSRVKVLISRNYIYLLLPRTNMSSKI